MIYKECALVAHSFFYLLGNSISRNKHKKYTLEKRVYERNKKWLFLKIRVI